MNAVEVSGECYETDSWDGDTMNSLGCGILCFREDLKNICVLIVQFYFGIFAFFFKLENSYSVVLLSVIWQSESIIHINSFFRFFSHIGHYRVLSGVPCAIQ